MKLNAGNVRVAVPRLDQVVPLVEIVFRQHPRHSGMTGATSSRRCIHADVFPIRAPHMTLPRTMAGLTANIELHGVRTAGAGHVTGCAVHRLRWKRAPCAHAMVVGGVQHVADTVRVGDPLTTSNRVSHVVPRGNDRARRKRVARRARLRGGQDRVAVTTRSPGLVDIGMAGTAQLRPGVAGRLIGRILDRNRRRTVARSFFGATRELHG